MKKLHVDRFLPFLFFLFVCLLTTVLYATIPLDVSWILLLELYGCLLLVFLMLFVPIPKIFSWYVVIHFGMALCLGTIFNFYNRIFFWDLLLHAYFGWMISHFFYWLCRGKISGFFLLAVVLFLISLGGAALWECMEYGMVTLFSMDTQKIAESIANGKSPVADTMEDILITMVGSLSFLGYLFKKERRISLKK